MDIDMSALRLLESEREIPLHLIIPTIEQALVMAYHKSPGAIDQARAELDQKTGRVTIWATEIDEDGTSLGEFDDTPEGFGRIAASTARQIILQRLRDVEDDNILGQFKGKEGQNARLAAKLTGWRIDISSDAHPQGRVEAVRPE